MLVGTAGVIRSGKTGLDTALTLIEAEKDNVEVFANFRINHPKIKYLETVDDFMALHLDEMNGLVCIQEMQVWIESRLSGKEITRAVDKVILQSGKLGFDILWDAQLTSSVDKRARLNTTSWFATRRKLPIPSKNPTDKRYMLRYIYLDERLGIHKFHLPARPEGWDTLKKLVLDKYDTRQLAELKRKWEINKKEGGLSDEHKQYEKTQTEPLVQPNGDAIDKMTPQIKDKPAPLIEQFLEKQMEIVS